jgi:GntR family transcriptional regulator
MTLRRAIDRLIIDGVVDRRPGSGTYVCRRPIVRILGLTSFTEDMTERGMRAGTRVVAFERGAIHAPISQLLGLTADSELVYIRRVRLADEEPIAVEESWLSAANVGKITESELEGSLYEVLEKQFGMMVATASAIVAACLASELDASELGIAVGDPCLRVSLTDFGADGKPIMIAESRYRADRYELSAQLNHGARRS